MPSWEALFLLIVLVVVILVGHGLWVLLAAIFKALFSSSEVERCRHCNRFAKMSNGRCRWCGKAQSAPLNDEAADIAAIGRQLRRWQARGLLKPDTVVRLLAKAAALQKSPVRPVAAKSSSQSRAPSGEPYARGGLTVHPVEDDGLEGRPTPVTKPARAGQPKIAPVVQAATTAAPTRIQPSAPPPVAMRPRRSFAEMLSTFMEERNIRWGELVGGLIIVCSSVALVVSIWDQLKAIPYFQFFIFVAVSAALFGIGLYTEHRWKLASTSRGVLTIATLLVPLNFVAMVATRRPGFDPVALVTELAALAVFSVLVYRAGRVLVEGWAGWLALAVVGNSGMLLLLIGRPSLVWATCVAIAATLLHAASLVKPLASVHRRQDLTAAIVNRLFMLGGAAAFALAVAFSMVVVRAGDHIDTLHAIAPLLAIGCVTILLCGVAVMRGLTTSDEAALRTAGTAVALVGAAAMLTAMAVAWPMAMSLVAVGLINFAALAAVAIVYRLRPLHLLAAASLSIAYLVACHWAAGHLADIAPSERAWALARLLIDGQTGLWLAGFVIVLFAVAEVLERRGRGADARYYLYAGAFAAPVSIALVSWPVVLSGGAESARAGLVFAAYGIAGLALNLRLRSRAVEALACALIYAAALLGTTAWLIDQPWVTRDPAQFASRPSLQCYAAACAAVSLAFVLLRVAAGSWWTAALWWATGGKTRGSESSPDTPWRESRSPEGDQALRHGVSELLCGDRLILRVISAAALLLAAWQAAPGVFAELFGTAVSTAAWANDVAPGWVLFSFCAAGLLAALWDSWRDDDVTAAILLSINAAVLAAIPAAPSAATASALRWALSSVFAVSAGLLWFRTNLAHIAQTWSAMIHHRFPLRRSRLLAGSGSAPASLNALPAEEKAKVASRQGKAAINRRTPGSGGRRLQTTTSAAPTARAIWLLATALPVVLCSALTAAMQISGRPAWGPLPGTWFARLGMEASHLIPLAVIVLTMIAYAIRETSPRYAFVGGLVANLTVTGGYALLIRRFGAVEAARLVQLATITAAVWAIGWLALRQGVLAGWRQPASPFARSLLRLQVAQAALGSLFLLATSTFLIFFSPTDGLPTELHAWVWAVGSPLGWLAVVVACAAALYRMFHFREGVRPELAGLFGLAVLSLAASSVEAVLPGTAWAYRTLMLGWAIYALAIVVAASRAAMIATRPYPGPLPEGEGARAGASRRAHLVRTASIWVRVSGLLAVALALKTVLFEGINSEELLWAAPAIGIASAACAAMAVWLRREGWAFTAGLGANLAASLIVAHRLAVGGHAVGEEWILLWQANTTAAAVVALVWLTAWRRMYARPISSAVSPLLTVQVGTVAVSAMGLAGTAVAVLLVSPAAQSLLAQRLAANAGWFAWLSACAAAAGYLYLVARRMLSDVLAVFLLGVGLRAAVASFVIDFATGISVLANAWIAAGFFLLVVGYVCERWLTSRSNPERGQWLREIFNLDACERWVAVIPILVAVVALRGTSLDAVSANGWGVRLLIAAVLPAALAVWLRLPWHLYSHALLINLAASLFWYAQPEPLWTDLIFANALAAAAMAIFWSIRSRLLGPIAKTPPTGAALPQPPAEHAAAIAAICLLVIGAVSLWFSAAVDAPLAANSRLAWLACAAVAAACGIALWDRRANFATAGVYATGLAAIALGLVACEAQGVAFVRLTAPCLAAWLCTAAGVRLGFAIRPMSSFAPRKNAFSRSERRPWRLPRQRGWRGWFAPLQAVFAVLATAVSLWIGVGFELPAERLAGPLTTALTLAAVLLMSAARGSWSGFWRIGALSLAAIVPAEAVWCWLACDDAAILWIHRQVALLTAIGLIVAGCELTATRRLASAAWLDSLRRFLPLAIGMLLALLSIILMHELHYRAGMPHAADGTRPDMPMSLVAKLAVVSVLVELIVLSLRYAVVAARDPLALTLRGRTAYVYAAELLALVICLHFRTTMPKLLPFSFIENWWTLVVMVVAFVGAGLSERFRRRQLEVLSLPLAHTAAAAPLVPVLALLLYLVWRPAGINEWLFHARLISDEAVFFLVAGFYALQARLQRSLAAAGFSALAGNVGLWLLWHRLRFEFLVHPQLWLIPPALAVLAAEYINRDRLSRQQSSAVRYLALSAIYVSSTADVFISHVGHDISLPLVLVLMGLSVLGILAGMLLEVRPFVYLGFTFLLVDLSIMVYHAAWDLGHTWVFWATGIAVGAAIIALFAVFEKRRNDTAKHIDSHSPGG